jgi:hypothetical protein
LWRALSGISDLMSFGLGGGNIYFESMPDFPWNMQWLPKDNTTNTFSPKKQKVQYNLTIVYTK